MKSEIGLTCAHVSILLLTALALGEDREKERDDTCVLGTSHMHVFTRPALVHTHHLHLAQLLAHTHKPCTLLLARARPPSRAGSEGVERGEGGGACGRDGDGERERGVKKIVGNGG